MSHETREWSLRRELAAAYRIFAHWGWDDLVFTHLSVKLPGEADHFLLNPFTLAFDEITASSLLTVNFNGQPIEGQDGITNPAGFVIHSALHMGRADAVCVMHLHTEAGQVVSSLADGLLPVCQTSMIAASGGVGYHEFEGIARDLDERKRLISDIGEANVLILRNHGTLTTGKTVGEAFLRMYFLERACRVQIQALASGSLHQPPVGMREFVANQAERDFEAAASLAWPAIMRKVERLYPETFE
ncbi:MAG: class II aldolase/adducin family protein [Pseudomonadota bacterium]